MSVAEQNTIWRCLNTSVFFLLIPLAVGIVMVICQRRQVLRKYRAGLGSMVLLSACILGAVWCLRYAVGYFTICCPEKGDDPLKWWEEIFNSIVHALQTFSMDEDYTSYIQKGRKMMIALTNSKKWADAYGVYASVLNTAAPIAGGAIILDILASAFPILKIRLAYLQIWREKAFFSELNEESMALAKSICAANKGKLTCPVIIFTDAYVDEGEEKRNELRLEAKMLGAICIRDDLLHVSKNLFGKRSYYLIDRDENKNLQALVDICDGCWKWYIRRAKIFLFVESDAYEQLERQVRSKLKKKFDEPNMPEILPVHSYRNLAYNLLVELPLYEPLVGKRKNGKKTDRLRVTIFGDGDLAIQLLLAVYWFGQILDHALQICVVSEKTEEQFRSDLSYINPEILKSTEAKDDILLYNKDNRSEPYATIHHVQADARNGEFWAQEDPAPESLRADYFVVALGSDEENMAAAEKLRVTVGSNHVREKSDDCAVIAYIVHNPRLCATLNEQRCFCHLRANQPDVYMRAFGSLEELYSRENIFMTPHAVWAADAGAAYSALQRQEDSLEDNRNRAGQDDGNYKYWSNLARAMHVKYKVFSLGGIGSSVFDSDKEDKQAHIKKVQAACARYKRIGMGQALPEDADMAAALERENDRLAWLEHRRWNAFLRTCGFRQSKAYKEYFEAAGNSYKHMGLKLHPCLVECNDDGMRAVFDDKGDLTGWKDQAQFDFLDELSQKLYDLKYTDVDKQSGEKTEKRYNDYDFKQYDYVSGEFISYLSQEDAAKKLGLTEKKLMVLCKRGKLNGAMKPDADGKWLIPKKTVKKILEEKSEKRNSHGG